VIKDYKKARYDLLAAAMELGSYSLDQLAEPSGSPRAKTTIRFENAVRSFKKSLRLEGKKETGLGYVRFQTMLSMLEEPPHDGS
jgi:hypothetical protein